MTPLGHLLADQIRLVGALRFDHYMALCAMHPQHGFYNRPDPVGNRSSFTTAPEISQMFGEMIGVCLARYWQQLGQPEACTLLELGPGRGTLMADLLRTLFRVSRLARCCRLVLFEQSSSLQEQQRARLGHYSPEWIESLANLGDRTVFAIANEFLDALAVRQFRRGDQTWSELHVTTQAEELVPVFLPVRGQPAGSWFDRARPGDIVEWRPQADQIMRQLAKLVDQNGGLVLIIDYGETQLTGSTLQAISANRPCELFANPGQMDLSAHVDFGALADAVGDRVAVALTSQRSFLRHLGIGQRARKLAQGLSGDRLNDHIAAYQRLIEVDEMGALFKVMALYRRNTPAPPGFEQCL